METKIWPSCCKKADCRAQLKERAKCTRGVGSPFKQMSPTVTAVVAWDGTLTKEDSLPGRAETCLCRAHSQDENGRQ